MGCHDFPPRCENCSVSDCLLSSVRFGHQGWWIMFLTCELKWHVVFTFQWLRVETIFFLKKKQWLRLWCGWIFSWNIPLVWADHTYKIIKSPINRLVRVFVNKWFYRSFDANFIENEETYKKISVVVVVVFVLFCFFPYK